MAIFCKRSRNRFQFLQSFAGECCYYGNDDDERKNPRKRSLGLRGLSYFI